MRMLFGQTGKEQIISNPPQLVHFDLLEFCHKGEPLSSIRGGGKIYTYIHMYKYIITYMLKFKA